MTRIARSFATAATPELLRPQPDVDTGPAASGRDHINCVGSGTSQWARSAVHCGAAAGDCPWVWDLPIHPAAAPKAAATTVKQQALWYGISDGHGRGWLRRKGPCSGAEEVGGGGVGGGGSSTRIMLLASLTTSAVAASGAGGESSFGSGAGGSGGSTAGSGGARLRHGFHLPQISIMRLPGPPSFAEDQELAQELLDYHTAKHGGFPRPCPRCKSSDFLVRSTDAGAAAAGTADGAISAAATANGASSDGGGVGGVIEWRSRPLRCEMCGVWVHLGCEGVDLVERVPPRPWFHCRACRDTYLRLEAAAQRNPHPSSASPAHALYVLTPADLAGLVGADPRGARATGTLPGEAATVPLGPAAAAAAVRARGPARAVVPLLAQGFNQDAIQGFGQPAREYDGGKYSAVLVHGGQPVAAATFNVFGREAQLCLLATATQHRLRGNGSALVADLESALADLGVAQLLVQCRGVALPLWLGRLGYSLVEPREAERLHRRLPIAYYDCALLEKRL